jgi:hypothetical protein
MESEIEYCIQHYSEKYDSWADSLFDRTIKTESEAYERLAENRSNFRYRSWRLIEKTVTIKVLDEKT